MKLKLCLITASVLLLAAGCQKQEVKNTPAPVQVQQQIVSVRQSVEGGKQNEQFSYPASFSKTALDLLTSSYKVETKTFSGAGEFVNSINGVKADTKHFWEFIVNGQSSNLGASSYTVNNGDIIEWKLTEIK